MPGDIPQAQGERLRTTLWHRFWFTFIGYWVCAVRGKLDRYAYLLAQAKVETDDLQSHFFYREKNPWCMHKGALFTRQYAWSDADGGLVGWYRSYMAAWMDRLDFDETRGIMETANAKAYGVDLVLKGRWFGTGSTVARADSYGQAIEDQMHRVPWVARIVTSAASEDPESSLPAWVQWLPVLLCVLFLFAFVMVVVKLYRWATSK